MHQNRQSDASVGQEIRSMDARPLNPSEGRHMWNLWDLLTGSARPHHHSHGREGHPWRNEAIWTNFKP